MKHLGFNRHLKVNDRTVIYICVFSLLSSWEGRELTFSESVMLQILYQPISTFPFNPQNNTVE